MHAAEQCTTVGVHWLYTCYRWVECGKIGWLMVGVGNQPCSPILSSFPTIAVWWSLRLTWTKLQCSKSQTSDKMPKIFLIRQGLQHQHDLLTQHQQDLNKQSEDILSFPPQRSISDELVNTFCDETNDKHDKEETYNQGKTYYEITSSNIILICDIVTEIKSLYSTLFWLARHVWLNVCLSWFN